MKKLGATLALALVAAAACGAGAAEVKDVYAEHGMVAAAHELAAKAGVEILQKGGNAIDAAVATALALNVVEFNASGIGGGGFMTFYSEKTKDVICLDYREQAPASATKDMFASEQAKKEKWSAYGGKSVGVPGWLKGMTYALENYGTMTFAQVAEPAIRLAEEGFVTDPAQKGFIQDHFETLNQFNDPGTLPFFDEVGLPIEGGTLLKQPALAKTFRLIAEKGIDVFYKGEIGEAVCRAVERTGGKMTMEDLASYRMYVRKPVVGTYRGYRIYSVPPASSGGTHVVQLLNIMENYDVKSLGFKSAKKVHVFGEATKMMFADRSKYMADTAYAKVPLAGLQSKEYAREEAGRITDAIVDKPEAGDPWKYDTAEKTSFLGGMGDERFSTSSFSVADQFGNVVTSTNTINFFMGSSVFVPEYGFLINDEMDDFASDPESVNAPEPGKRPLSCMSPTIVLDPEGRPFMSIGSPGATRIITAVAQCIMNAVDHGMTMDEAIEAARFHNQSGNEMRTENDRYDKALLDTLELMGYKISLQEPLYTGGAQGIMFNWNAKGTDKFLNGGADSRRLGAAVGF